MNLLARTYFEFLKPNKIEKELDRLVEQFHLQLQSEHRQRRVWLDTFDWQLFAQGKSLSLETGGDHHCLLLHRLEDGELLSRQPIEILPRFAHELPDSRLAHQLEPTFPPRAWLQQARQSEAVQVWGLLDPELKTLARIEYHAIKPLALHSGIEPTPLPLLVLRTLRGYEEQAEALFSYLNNRKSIRQLSHEEVFLRSVRGAGRDPGSYSSRFKLKLNRHQTTDSALRAILTELLHAIELNLPDTLDDTDSEFLHDLRVAVRRSRSALTRIKDVFAEEKTEHFQKELRWIGSITGKVRDLDVYLLAVPEFAKRLPDTLRPQLKVFEDYLHDTRQQERKVLVAELSSERMQTFLREWKAFLAEKPGAADLSETGIREVQRTAGNATWKMYCRVIKDGHQLTSDSPAERFHELRKDMKKLRYLMELFASLYPAKDWKVQLKLQKALQDILGDFQDLEIQAEHMIDIGRALHQRSDCKAETLMALGILSEQLREQQAHALDHFAEAFARLASNDSHDTFKRLCTRGRKEEKE